MAQVNNKIIKITVWGQVGKNGASFFKNFVDVIQETGGPSWGLFGKPKKKLKISEQIFTVRHNVNR